MHDQSRSPQPSEQEEPDSPARRRQRKRTGLLVLTTVVLIDGSYLLVLALSEGARLTLGSALPGLLLLTPLPAILSGSICFGMTRGSRFTANAGETAAWVVLVTSLAFALLKLSNFRSYGNEMDGVIVVVEMLVTGIVAAVTLILCATFARLASPRGC